MIADIWHRVAEDFAPFDNDVTTERPVTFGPLVGHVMITKDTDAYGLSMPSKGAGGVAYVNVWGGSNYATYYSPAFVYYNNLGTTSAHNIAEAAAHEFGHNLGLSHEGTSTTAYYSGLGTGNVSWGPIMGVGYYAQVTQWSKGEYPDANNLQDDVAIIAAKLATRPDDKGNTPAPAAMLAVDADGTVWSSNQETTNLFGFLVPGREKRKILGTLFDSSIYPNRAPEGHVLLRTIVGGARSPEIALLDDDRLVETVRSELAEILGIKADPELIWMYRWEKAIPQYLVGHHARLRKLDERLAMHRGLYLHGNAYRGVAVNDCIAQSFALSDTISSVLRCGAERSASRSECRRTCRWTSPLQEGIAAPWGLTSPPSGTTDAA